MYPRKLIILVAFFLVALPLGTAHASPADSSTITYKIALGNPSQRRLHVECDISRIKKGPVEFRLPSWSPGSYTFRPLSQFIANLRVDDRGRALSLRETGSDTYEVDENSGRLHIEYDVNLSEQNLSLDKSFIGNDVALIKGDFTFCLVEGHRATPARVEVSYPSDWKLLTSLSPAPGGGGFVAGDYDELIDGSIMLGRFETASLTAGGVEFVIAVDPNLHLPPTELAGVVKRLADYQIGLFGTAPFRRYIFFVHVITETYFNLFPSGVFGIEHRNATTISFTPQAATVIRGKYLIATLEKLFAHELFHGWNGKRISPVELHRPELNQRINSPNIWFIEGVTRYYDILSAFRAGGHRKQWLYGALAELIQEGNVAESLEQKSAEAWRNLSPVLYKRGGLVALALDLKIRSLTGNARSLDDVMRELYRQARRLQYYTASSLRNAVSGVAGRNMDDFFARYVSGRELVDVDEVLGQAGLEAIFGDRQVPQDVGIFFDKSVNQVVALLPGGAGEAAGLQPKDKVLAINGQTLSSRPFDQAFASDSIGSSYELRILRDDREMTLLMTINAIREAEVRIVESKNATPEQGRVREGLLGQAKDQLRPVSDRGRRSAPGSSVHQARRRLQPDLATALERGPIWLRIR